MSAQDTTAAVADAETAELKPVEELVEVQVIAAGCSYFKKEYVLGPDGEPETLPSGEKQTITLRHEATMGDLIKVHPHQARQLIKGGFVREPSDKPLLPPLQATPFTVPLVTNPETGEAEMAAGPIMGDPNPSSPEEHGKDADRLPLTPEQRAELEAREAARTDADGFNAAEATDDELMAHLEGKSVEETLAVAKGADGQFDEQVAARVLEHELAQDSPRKGVVEPLEKVSE